MKYLVQYKKEFLSGKQVGKMVEVSYAVENGEKQHTLYSDLLRRATKRIVGTDLDGSKFLVSSPQKDVVPEDQVQSKEDKPKLKKKAK